MSSPSSSSNSNHNTTTGNHHWLLSLAAGGTTPNHPTTNDLQPVAATVAAPPTSNSTPTSSSALMSSVLDRLQLVQQLQAARRLETTATATPPRTTTTTTTTTTSSSSTSALAHQLLQGRLWIEQYQWLVEHTRLHKPLTPALQQWAVTQQANYARLDASKQRLLQLVGISGHPSSSTSTTNSSSGATTNAVLPDHRKKPATCTTTTTITAQLLLDLAQQRRDGSPAVATSTKTTTSTTNKANSKASTDSNPAVVPSSTAGKTSKITSTSTTTKHNKHTSHTTTTSTPHPHHAAAWNNMYHKLQEYHRTHGDCQVPQDYPPDPPLGRWVMTQRDQHHHGQLSLERYNALTQIGFCWRTRRGKPSCPKLAHYWHDKWTTMYELLVAYVQSHGHAKVPYKYTCPTTGVALGQWVSKQRKKYGRHNHTPTSLQQQGLYAAKERALLQELGVLGEDQRRGTSSTTTAIAVASSSVQQTDPTLDERSLSSSGPAKKRRRRMETFFSDAGKKCDTPKVQPMPPPSTSSRTIAELQASVDQLWQRQTSIDVQDVAQVEAQLVQHQRLVQTLQSSCQTLRTLLLAAGPQQSPSQHHHHQQRQQQQQDED